MLRKVDFLIAGTQKGGTAALQEYLNEHPEICMANKKEIHFFDNETYFENSPDYSIYHSFFSPSSPHQLLGEATPIYMYWYDAPRRIWQYNPQIKIILMLRNPVERAYSHWNMERSLKSESAAFWDALQTEQERSREALPYQHRVYSYTDRGFYVEQLRRIWRYFPKHQTLILKSEDLKTKPREILDQVCEFLGISKFLEVNEKRSNLYAYIAEMSPQEKEYLQQLYEFEIRSLEQILGWDCSQWLARENEKESPKKRFTLPWKK